MLRDFNDCRTCTVQNLLKWKTYSPDCYATRIHIMFLGLSEKLSKLKEKFGELSSFPVLGKRVIILNDHLVAKEALVGKGDVFAGRPKFDPMSKLIGGYGIRIFVH